MFRVDMDTATIRVYPGQIPACGCCDSYNAVMTDLIDNCKALAEALTRQLNTVFTVEVCY